MNSLSNCLWNMVLFTIFLFIFFFLKETLSLFDFLKLFFWHFLILKHSIPMIPISEIVRCAEFPIKNRFKQLSLSRNFIPFVFEKVFKNIMSSTRNNLSEKKIIIALSSWLLRKCLICFVDFNEFFSGLLII